MRGHDSNTPLLCSRPHGHYGLVPRNFRVAGDTATGSSLTLAAAKITRTGQIHETSMLVADGNDRRSTLDGVFAGA
jgi:hypothetical protein